MNTDKKYAVDRIAFFNSDYQEIDLDPFPGLDNAGEMELPIHVWAMVVYFGLMHLQKDSESVKKKAKN